MSVFDQFVGLALKRISKSEQVTKLSERDGISYCYRFTFISFILLHDQLTKFQYSVIKNLTKEYLESAVKS